jgi:hypothetical protein
MRDDEAQGGEIGEEIALHELHEGDRVGRDVKGACRVQPGLQEPETWIIAGTSSSTIFS